MSLFLLWLFSAFICLDNYDKEQIQTGNHDEEGTKTKVWFTCVILCPYVNTGLSFIFIYERLKEVYANLNGE